MFSAVRLSSTKAFIFYCLFQYLETEVFEFIAFFYRVHIKWYLKDLLLICKNIYQPGSRELLPTLGPLRTGLETFAPEAHLRHLIRLKPLKRSPLQGFPQTS